MRHLLASVLTAICLLLVSCPILAQTQTVFLDFDSMTTGGDHLYTAAERDAIEDYMGFDYSSFDYAFTQTLPVSGDFSTVVFNDGPAFGLADAIDFRNLDRNDDATVDVNSGASTSAEFITLSANVASHELGHLAGLRHGDSFGAIGFGIDPGTVNAGGYLPQYRGPGSAVETMFNIMEADSTFIEDVFDQSFSERSAVKLAFNESPNTIAETGLAHDDFTMAQALSLSSISVPNTRMAGQENFGKSLAIDAVGVIDASLSGGLEEDWYSFTGFTGDLFNFEVMSNALDRIADTIDPQIEIWMDDGIGGLADVPYYTDPTTFNDDEFESFDSILIDLFLPTDNTYFIRVTPNPSNPSGDYELFGYRFQAVAVPEPGSLAMLSFMLGAVCVRRRR